MHIIHIFFVAISVAYDSIGHGFLGGLKQSFFLLREVLGFLGSDNTVVVLVSSWVQVLVMQPYLSPAP